MLEVDVWPVNWPTVELFGQMNTQWLTGFSGRTGLRYDVLFQLLDRAGYVGQEWQRVFYEIREMEREALDAMAEHNE